MKQKVSNYLQAVPVGVWKKVGQNFGAQINDCPNRGGAHIENVTHRDFAKIHIFRFLDMVRAKIDIY